MAGKPEGERLPWIEAPRTPESAGGGRDAARRRKLSRGPIYALLLLFLLASVGVMSFLVGRGSMPIAPTEVPPPPVPPMPPARTVTPPASVPTPAPSSVPAAEPAKSPTVPRATPARKAAAKRSVSRAKRSARAAAKRRAARRARAAAATRLEAVRAAQTPPLAPPAIRRTAPLVSASRVVQLGTYRSRWQADAAHMRLARGYPYVRALPKAVRPVHPNGSRRTFYRLQLYAYSPEYARILCRQLRSVGRGCVVLPQAR